jgi:hypothetical protein
VPGTRKILIGSSGPFFALPDPITALSRRRSVPRVAGFPPRSANLRKATTINRAAPCAAERANGQAQCVSLSGYSRTARPKSLVM